MPFEAVKLSKQSPAFRNERVVWLKNTDEKNVVTFLGEDDRNQFLVAMTFANRPGATAVEVANVHELFEKRL